MIHSAAQIAALYSAILLLGPRLASAQSASEPRSFFRQQIGLSDHQIASIAEGKPIAKLLPSQHPSELLVFGAVFVNATAEEYARLAFDMTRLRNSPNYLAVGQLTDSPQLTDLQGFTLEPDEIRNLRTCQPGTCNVQLPGDIIRDLQATINWSSPNAAAQVNDRVRRMALETLRQYRRDGNRALGIYRDTGDPFDVNAQFKAFLARFRALPVYLPELDRYLLDYPKSTLANVQSVFFWEKVNFGLKPTLRLNHGFAYRSDGPRGSAHVVAVKQLYASHYLQVALDLTACVPETRAGGQSGFYLISLKGSNQQGLTGFTGSLLRRIIVSRTRAAQLRMLMNIKRSLEQKH